MKLLRILLLVVVAISACYLCDYLILRLRIRRNSAFGTVTIQTLYEMKQKNGKTDLSIGEAQDVMCVRSLFPHYGDAPCWYLRRHTDQVVKI